MIVNKKDSAKAVRENHRKFMFIWFDPMTNHNGKCQTAQITPTIMVLVKGDHLFCNVGCKKPRQPISSSPPPIIMIGNSSNAKYIGFSIVAPPQSVGKKHAANANPIANRYHETGSLGFFTLWINDLNSSLVEYFFFNQISQIAGVMPPRINNSIDIALPNSSKFSCVNKAKLPHIIQDVAKV